MIFVKCLNRQKQIPVEKAEDVKMWEDKDGHPVGVTIHSSTGEDYDIPFHSVGFIVDTHKASRPRDGALPQDGVD